MNNPLTLNLYTYVANNPLKYIDPSGNSYCYSESACKALDEKLGLSDNSTSNKRLDEMSYDEIMNLLLSDGVSHDDKVRIMAYIEVHYVLGAAAIKEIRALAFGTKAVVGVTKACNCFTAGTKVLTDEGEKPIEEIEVGDKVLSKSDETGEVEYKEVVKLFQKQADEIYYVRIGDKVIETTGLHPFWLDEKGWTLVQDLKVGDLLVSNDGTKLGIEKIEKAPRHETVYNFMVADYHSYFVSNLGIWVHNCTILTAGKNFKSHFLDHKKLLENALGTKYQKYNDETTAKFLSDLGSLIDNGTVKFVGNATLQKGGEVYKVYRGNGLTLTTKQNGEWHTLLESGKGMDLKFLFQ